MTSTLQATVSDPSAAVPPQTQTSSYNSQFAQMHASFNQLLAQTPQTSSSPLPSQIQFSSGPLVAQAQGSSGLPLTQAQGPLGIHPAQNQVRVFTLTALLSSNYGLFLVQDHSRPVLRPGQMPVGYGMQAAPVLGSVRGQPAQMAAIPGLVPSQFQTSYSEQPVPIDMSNLQPMPGMQWAPEVPFPSYREGTT